MNITVGIMNHGYVHKKTESHTFFATLAALLIGAGILLSAIGVVYIKDLNRRLFIQYQGVMHSQQQDEIIWSKLLLEQSTWASQTRIQHYARNRLHMFIPKAHDIVIVERSAQHHVFAALTSKTLVLANNTPATRFK